MNAIQEYLNTARTVSPQQLESKHARIEEINVQIRRLHEARGRLFGLEQHAATALLARRTELMREVGQLKALAVYGEYPCLGVEALTWRGDKGWPRIALLGLDSPKTTLGVHRTRGYSGDLQYHVKTSPALPPALLACYKDVFDKLRAQAKAAKKSVYLVSEFTGIIPEATRDKIAKAKDKFKTVFVAAEAKKWDVVQKPTTVVRPHNADPLVLGWDGNNLWVIDHFDMTSVERYLKNEFTVSAAA